MTDEIDRDAIEQALREAGAMRASGSHYTVAGKLALLQAYTRILELYPAAKTAGLTDIHIAELVGVSRPQLWKIRQGQTEVQAEPELAELLGLRAARG